MNNENIREAKRMSLEFKKNSLQQLILLRYESLTTISSICFAVAGVGLSLNENYIKNKYLAFISLVIFILIALTGLGRFLYLLRSDIKNIAKKIINLPQEDWNKPLKESEFNADYWPEVLYGLLVVGILLFSFSFVNLCF